jgi:competence protein ComGD
MAAVTLVETLVVLAIVAQLAGIPMIYVKSYQEEMAAREFLALFEKRLKGEQSLAITGGVETSVVFGARRVHFSNAEVLELPDCVTLVEAPGVISFKAASGNYSALKKVVLYNRKKDELVTYQFQMGSGRFVKKIG